MQSETLIAGQITKQFLLENSGTSDILGIKLKPTVLTHLYDLDMSSLTDKVVDAKSILSQEKLFLEKDFFACGNHEEKIFKAEKYFQTLPALKSWKETPADKAVTLVFEKKGMITVTELCSIAGVGERQLENLFKKYIGLSPKFFSRVIRFTYIFELVQKNKQRWSALAYEAAYYDQSHFIRNFKNFTGENPSAYSFDEKNMANFFLNKK
jgi:AraC-like DNA-binding protein